MAIGLENFQPETFEQANPFLTGYSAAQQIANQAIQNRLQGNQANQVGIQNRYLGPTLQQQLVGLRQTNQIQQPYAQNALPYAQAQLQQLQALPGLTGAETAAQFASAQAQRAQAGLTGQQETTLKALTGPQTAHAAATVYTQPFISALNQIDQWSKAAGVPNFLSNIGGLGNYMSGGNFGGSNTSGGSSGSPVNSEIDNGNPDSSGNYNFSTKQKAHAWANSLSPQQLAQLRKQGVKINVTGGS